MKIYPMLIAVAALVTSCGSPDSRETAADRVANVTAARDSSTPATATVKQLEAKLNTCSAAAGCPVQPILEALWMRGYCRTSSESTIAECTPQEIADDRSTTAEFGRR